MTPPRLPLSFLSTLSFIYHTIIEYQHHQEPYWEIKIATIRVTELQKSFTRHHFPQSHFFSVPESNLESPYVQPDRDPDCSPKSHGQFYPSQNHNHVSQVSAECQNPTVLKSQAIASCTIFNYMIKYLLFELLIKETPFLGRKMQIHRIVEEVVCSED